MEVCLVGHRQDLTVQTGGNWTALLPAEVTAPQGVREKGKESDLGWGVTSWRHLHAALKIPARTAVPLTGASLVITQGTVQRE